MRYFGHEAIVIGRTISHYQILEKLGAGGMGVVYRARDVRLDRDVVLKFLPPSLTADQEGTKRLIQEAKAASALDHPNICTIYGLESPDGQAFISMAYYPGEVLEKRLELGPLPPAQALHITRQIASGLGAAHARGIIHRDIKPGNIVVARDGVVKIVDFGVAKLAGASRITQTGMTVGTAAYISPEQMRGREVDHRTDIWSLGVVLYEMITGVRPFHGDSAESLIYSILTTEPAPMTSLRPGVPEELDRIVRKALVKDPAGRYSAMGAMLRDLNSIEAPSDSGAPAIAVADSPHRREDRRLGRAAAAGVVALLLAGGGMLLWRSRRPSGGGAPVAHAAESTREVSTTHATRLAVMPFANRRNDSATDYLAYALADRITDRLSYYEGIVVRPSKATREYGSQGVDLVPAGKKLRVDYILTGGFSSDGQTVRLDSELVNVQSAIKTSLEPVKVGYDDAFRLQDIVAEEVIRGLDLRASTREQDRKQADVPRNPLAYQDYLRGLSCPHTKEGHQLALEMLEKSIALDPGYAPAYVELGGRLQQVAIYAQGGKATTGRAEEAFRKALSLNGELLGARSGFAQLYTEVGEIDKAVGLLRDALKTNPGHAESHFALSYSYRYAGMLQESAEEGEKALTLDPNNPRYRSLATTYLYLGNYDRALEVHKLDPDSPWTLARMGQIFLRRGQARLALEQFDRTIEREPESSTGRWAFAMKAALRGRREEGLAALTRSNEAGMVDGEQRYHFANIHCLLGDRDGCLRGLQAAVQGGFFNYPFMQRDSFLDPVRREPKFLRILAEAKAKHEVFRARFFPNGAGVASRSPRASRRESLREVTERRSLARRGSRSRQGDGLVELNGIEVSCWPCGPSGPVALLLAGGGWRPPDPS